MWCLRTMSVGSNRNYYILFIIFLSILFLNSNVFSLQEPTHKSINQFVSQNTIIDLFSLDSYLRDRLGFEDGATQILKSNQGEQRIWQWIAQGGIEEDNPSLRSFNHYHNPLRIWNEAGLKGSVLGNSSIIWAQYRDQSFGKYCWQDVRGYFYKALTSLDKVAREANFVETFSGLGQLMHLVQDSSVPDHTRDDIHLLFGYEE